MELIILYLPLFILIYSFYSLPINPGFPVSSLFSNNSVFHIPAGFDIVTSSSYEIANHNNY